jgi:hypothetical protein
MIWKIWKKSKLKFEIHFNLLFFHIFHIISHFNLFFFHIFHIISQFNLLFFRIFHTFSLFNLLFLHIFITISHFNLLFFRIFHTFSLYNLLSFQNFHIFSLSVVYVSKMWYLLSYILFSHMTGSDVIFPALFSYFSSSTFWYGKYTFRLLNRK